MSLVVKDNISKSSLFVCLIPEEGLLPGTEGMDQLLYAIELGKPILYWIPKGRRVKVPEYPGVIIHGDGGALQRAVQELLESQGEPGEPIEIEVIDGGW